MSIEAMKRIKSLLQDTKMIDSHTISAVVAECDMAILAKQPTTPEPDEWKLVPIVPTEKMLLAYTGGAVTNAGFRWCRHQWSVMLAAAPAAHPSPSVPADVVRVPLQVLKDASEALGNFVSDHGWGDADMQAMDNLDAYIARHEANRAAMLAAK